MKNHTANQIKYREICSTLAGRRAIRRGQGERPEMQRKRDDDVRLQVVGRDGAGGAGK